MDLARAKGKFLAATDGSPASGKAVDYAVRRAKEAGVPLTIVMAVEATLMGAPSTAGASGLDLPGQVKKEAWAVVRAAEARAREAGVDARGEVVETYPPSDVASAIVKFAESTGATEVFVGSHGRSGILRQLLGSVAEKVVRLAHCHVTVVR